MLTLLVWCNKGIKQPFNWQQGVSLWLVGSTLHQRGSYQFVHPPDTEGYLTITPPFWSCEPWPSSMSSCVSHGVHCLMLSMGSNVISLAKCMCSFQHLHPLHITWSLPPSSVVALADVHSRSHNFLLIHPMEVLLAGHWVTAWPLLSCDIITSSLPPEVGLHVVGPVHLSHAWWTPIHKGTLTSDAMRRSWFWLRMHDCPHWSITS